MNSHTNSGFKNNSSFGILILLHKNRKNKANLNICYKNVVEESPLILMVKPVFF